MEINELLAIVIPLVTLTLSLLIFALKGIHTWERLQEKKDREHIEAVVDLRFENKLDEMKKNYAEMVQLLRDGTFK